MAIIRKICYNNSMITEKVKNTILDNRLIENDEHIVIGLSGGPDSVCLFHILLQLKETFGIMLHAVHINHGLRPGAAGEDQNYAEELCKAYGVSCHTFFFDVKKIAKETGTSSEDAGRRVRYQSFFDVAEKISLETGKLVKVAVAQNMNDQAETMLMRILRGTGTDGLCGIEYFRLEKNRGIIIRPLLDITRKEIENYCEENHLNPQIDLTNLEPIYTRNKIRIELLPYLKENFNPNVISALHRLSRIAKEDKDYFNQRVDAMIDQYELNRVPDCVGMPLAVLRSQHPAIRNRLIMRLFESIGLSNDITAVHLKQADRLMKEGKTSAAIDFSAGYAMGISYGVVNFYKKKGNRKADHIEYEINLDGITEVFELKACIRVKILRRQDWENSKEEDKIGNNSIACRLSLDKIKASGCVLLLRTRKQGDYICPLGMKGRKKLQNFFVDEKINRQDRDRTPILCLGSEVIWVVGSRINENYKVEDDTESIILLEYSSKI